MRAVKRQAFIGDHSTARKKTARALYSMVRALCIPDKAAPWVPFAIAAGWKSQATHSSKVMFSTSPLFSNHLVAQALHTRWKVPWIADFRDYHYIEALENERGLVNRLTAKVLERGIMDHADALVFISPQMRDRYVACYPRIGRKAHVVPNGFDPDEYSPSVPVDSRRLTIFYAGSFCQGERSPASLFACLDELVKRGHIRRDEISIRIAGVVEREVFDMLRQFHVFQSVELLGILPRAQILREMQQAHLLWLIVGSANNHADGFPTKGYEYMGAGRPILAFVPADSNAARLIRSTETGEVLDVADSRQSLERNCEIMIKFITQYRSDELMRPAAARPAKLEAFTRQFQARQIAEIADMIVTKSEPATALR